MPSLKSRFLPVPINQLVQLLERVHYALLNVHFLLIARWKLAFKPPPEEANGRVATVHIRMTLLQDLNAQLLIPQS
ncbi:hypothetical protein TB1_008195 [Malus domestica]